MFVKTFQFKVTYEREVLSTIINGIMTLLTVLLTKNCFPGLIKTDSYWKIFKLRNDYNRAWLIETDWSHVNLPLHICSPHSPVDPSNSAVYPHARLLPRIIPLTDNDGFTQIKQGGGTRMNITFQRLLYSILYIASSPTPRNYQSRSY